MLVDTVAWQGVAPSGPLTDGGALFLKACRFKTLTALIDMPLHERKVPATFDQKFKL